MDPLTIGALVAMIGGAAVQQKAQSDALKRQQREAVAANQRQLAAQNQATAKASQRAEEFDPTRRQQAQQALEQQLTGELQQQVQGPQITAQGVQVGTTIPGGTQDYVVAKAKEQAKATASLRELAALMGRIGSAGELRRNEAVALGDTAGDIGRIQRGADNVFGVDQVAINAAGQPSVGAMLAGEALKGAGGLMLAGGAGKAAKLHGSAGGNMKFPEFGMTSGGQGAWL
jgi:hypothetical protein